MKKNFDLIIGIVLVMYYIIINVISTRKVAFSGAILAVGIVLIIFHFTKDIIKSNELLSNILKVSKILMCIGLVIFLIVESMIVIFPKKSKEAGDYILVLGAGVNRDGSLSQTLKDRLDAALTCINDFDNNGFIVVSGGQGPDELTSEAEAMKKYLVEKGVPEDKVIMEDKSTSTGENFKFSRSKIEEYSGKDVEDLKGTVITTDFHALRSSMLAKKNEYGEVNLYTSNTLWYLAPTFYTREVFALAKSIVFD